jgi:hypothetical protein
MELSEVKATVVVVAVALAAAAGCASLKGPPCAPTGLTYEGLPVYHYCDVDLQAKPTIANAVVPFDAPTGSKCYRAIFELIVDQAGNFVLSSSRPIRVNDSTFYKAAVTSLMQQRWEPARKNDVAVAQVVRMDRRMTVGRPVGGC